METKGYFIYEAGKYRRKPKIINFNLLSLFKMTRKDILKDSGKISHEEAMNHARKEYYKYKDRIALKPSEVELHYLESIKDLEKLEYNE